jgi:hypothetical protein
MNDYLDALPEDKEASEHVRRKQICGIQQEVRGGLVSRPRGSLWLPTLLPLTVGIARRPHARHHSRGDVGPNSP